MRLVDLRGVTHTGADIVRDQIAQNQHYATDGIAFRQVNLLEDPLPKADLVFCRDCLVHFSFEDVFRALHNIAASGSDFLLTTTFPGGRATHRSRPARWQPLNVSRAVLVSPPITLITEGCTEADGQ